MALQELLIRRAAAWAASVAPEAAFVAVEGSLDGVAGLLPPGVTAFEQQGCGPADVLARAIERIGRGPLLIGAADCPRLGVAHAAAALDDLAAGCDVVIGATLEGGWYLAGLREPRPELLTVAPDAWQREGGIALVLGRAAELGAEVGMLRHERLLVTPGRRGGAAGRSAGAARPARGARELAPLDPDRRARPARDAQVGVAIGGLPGIEVLGVAARSAGGDAVVACEALDPVEQAAQVRGAEFAARAAELEVAVEQVEELAPRRVDVYAGEDDAALARTQVGRQPEADLAPLESARGRGAAPASRATFFPARPRRGSRTLRRNACR